VRRYNEASGRHWASVMSWPIILPKEAYILKLGAVGNTALVRRGE